MIGSPRKGVAENRTGFSARRQKAAAGGESVAASGRFRAGLCGLGVLGEGGFLFEHEGPVGSRFE